MLAKALAQLHIALLADAHALLNRKMQDYGFTTDALANLKAAVEIGADPRQGCLLRLQDKLARLAGYVRGNPLANEGVRDTILDIINYAVLFAALDSEPRLGAEPWRTE